MKFVVSLTSIVVRSAEEFDSFSVLLPLVMFLYLTYKICKYIEEQLFFFRPAKYAISKSLPFSIIM